MSGHVIELDCCVHGVSCGGGCCGCQGTEHALKERIAFLESSKAKAVEEAVRLQDAYNEDLKRRLVAKEKEAQSARREALEEAAKIADMKPCMGYDRGCDGYGHHIDCPREIAAAIRSKMV